MPKDDWAKYARRDRGRKALATGDYFRATAQGRPKKRRPKRRRKRKHSATVREGGFVIEYNGATPETSTIRFIKSGPIHNGLPPWPGFT